MFLGAHQKLMSSQVVGWSCWQDGLLVFVDVSLFSCLAWSLLCRSGWLGTQQRSCLCFLKAEVKDVCHYSWYCFLFNDFCFLTCNNLWKMWYCFIIICKRLVPNVGLESVPAEPLCSWAGPPRWLGDFTLTRPLDFLPPTKLSASLVCARPVLIGPSSVSSDRGLSLSQLGSANIFRSRKKKVTITQNSFLHPTCICLVF